MELSPIGYGGTGCVGNANSLAVDGSGVVCQARHRSKVSASNRSGFKTLCRADPLGCLSRFSCQQPGFETASNNLSENPLTPAMCPSIGGLPNQRNRVFG